MYMHDEPKQLEPIDLGKVLGNMFGGLLLLVAIGGILYVPASCVYRHRIAPKKMEYIYIVTPDERVVFKSSTNTGVSEGAYNISWTDLDGGYHNHNIGHVNTVYILPEPHERYEKGKKHWILKNAEP